MSPRILRPPLEDATCRATPSAPPWDGTLVSPRWRLALNDEVTPPHAVELETLPCGAKRLTDEGSAESIEIDHHSTDQPQAMTEDAIRAMDPPAPEAGSQVSSQSSDSPLGHTHLS
jgi:hypothetical protein